VAIATPCLTEIRPCPRHRKEIYGRLENIFYFHFQNQKYQLAFAIFMVVCRYRKLKNKNNVIFLQTNVSILVFFF
jgi:hypothetical protein